MKKNTATLLLLLLPYKSSSTPYLTPAKAAALMPSFTSGGLRSTLFHLQSEGLLSSEKIAADTHYYLTQKGESALMAQFPSLSPEWETYTGSWQCLVFQTAPAGDPQFRYLRTQLLKERAAALSRGVYCVPRTFSNDLLALCNRLYTGAVTIFTVASWDFGFERAAATNHFSVADLATAYSGISREIESLLATTSAEQSMTDQQKKDFLSVCARFRDSLADDCGIGSYYYPNSPTARQLLSQLQLLATRL